MVVLYALRELQSGTGDDTGHGLDTFSVLPTQG